MPVCNCSSVARIPRIQRRHGATDNRHHDRLSTLELPDDPAQSILRPLRGDMIITPSCIRRVSILICTPSY